MPDQMFLVITLRFPVPTRDRAREIFDLVKARLAEYTTLIVHGHVTNHFDTEQPPP